MKLQLCIATAKQQFAALTLAEKNKIMESYATDELELTGLERLQYLAANPMDVSNLETQQGDNFYHWYYLNYAAQGEWNVKFYHPSLSTFRKLKIYPIRKYEEDNEMSFARCTRELANLWSLYIDDLEGGERCLADCKDELTAVKLKQLLQRLFKHWQTKIILLMEKGYLSKILSSQAFDYLHIDLDNPDSIVRKTITHVQEPNASIGKFYKGIEVQGETDLLVRNILKESRF